MTDERRKIVFVPAWYPNEFQPGLGTFSPIVADVIARRFRSAVLFVHFHDDAKRGTWMDVTTRGEVLEVRRYVHRRFRAGFLFPLLYGFHFWRAYERLEHEMGRPDLLYLGSLLPGGIGALMARARRGIPYATIEYFSGFSDSMRSRVKRLLVGRVLKRAALNSAVGGPMRETILGFFKRVQIEVNTNVIEVKEPCCPDSIRAAGKIEDGAKMIFVGNLVEVKGWDILLEALALYSERYGSGLSLTMIGGGEEAALTRKVEALGLGDVVKHIGRQPHEEVLKQISAHHFLALPSRVDTCPNVILEAHREGRPVLATRCGGPEDLVNEADGILVDKNSSADLAEGMHEMITRYGDFNPDTIIEQVRRDHRLEVLLDFLSRALDR